MHCLIVERLHRFHVIPFNSDSDHKRHRHGYAASDRDSYDYAMGDSYTEAHSAYAINARRLSDGAAKLRQHKYRQRCGVLCEQ